MAKFLIRFNKSKGKPGRGSNEHVWRVFENNKEWLVKHIKINTEIWDEKSTTSDGQTDWNIACEGKLELNRETSTAIITKV
jgi:hypothetical protein